MTGEPLIETVRLLDRFFAFGGWEVQQTHESLRPYLLEEAHELLDAIASGDPELIKEELGDLLLQVVFQARIAQMQGTFDIDDVARTLIAKLVHRSPHVLDELTGEIDVAAQELAWEQRKAVEKSRESCLDGIPLTLPALALAHKVIARATRAGFPAERVPAALSDISADAEQQLRDAVLTLCNQVREWESGQA